MKKYFLFLMILSCFKAKSQSVSNELSNSLRDSAVARNFSNKLRDSFALTLQQTDSIFIISRDSRGCKRKVWEKEKYNVDVQKKMLEVDSRRDSLFQKVLGNDKYVIYSSNRYKYLLTN